MSAFRPCYSCVSWVSIVLLMAACGDDSGNGDSDSTSATAGLTTTVGTTQGTASATMTTGSGSESATESSSTGGSSTTAGLTTGETSTSTSGSTTGDSCGGCPGGFKCKYDTCIPDLGECENYDDCPGDSYCDDDGECIPYGVPPDIINDPLCVKDDIPEGVTPVVQCEWNGVGDANDPTKGSTFIYTTPIIADLNLDKDPNKLQPSIIVTTFEGKGGLGRIGTLRVFDGRTCTEQMRAGGADEVNDDNRPAYAVPWAVADLDADVPNGGHPELISYRRVSANDSKGPVNLYALRVVYENDVPKLERMWYGRDCETDTVLSFGSSNMLEGPVIRDLNNDAYPEILVGEMVFDGDGCLLTNWDASKTDLMPIIDDVDLDGTVDIVTQRKFASWDVNTSDWIDKPGFIPDNANYPFVQLGLADFGLYTAINGKETSELPEVAILSTGFNNYGTLRIQKLFGGQAVWGPIPIYVTGKPVANRGGPITISDFDGDGQVELASAGATHYAVYDPDCVAALMGNSPPERPGGKCDRTPEQEAKNLPDGVLWIQPSQDISSNITGSSIFDFNGDGAAEAVYRDECFVRVYNGKSGEVIFSAPASSGTGMEYPTIADVDGDFSTEIIVPRTPYDANCPATDPLFPESGTFKTATGFVIYRDPLDRWANSRPVWNQHLYSVTHITDSVEVPPSGSIEKNWLFDGMNNLRQNSQGDVGKLLIADLTVELTDLGELCSFEGGTKELQAEVCNRGTNPVVDGVVVQFLETMDPDQGVDEAMVVCEAATTKLLMPGDCEIVMCTAELGGTGNIFVDVDPEDLIADCHPGNNLGADAFGLCPG